MVTTHLSRRLTAEFIEDSFDNHASKIDLRTLTECIEVYPSVANSRLLEKLGSLAGDRKFDGEARKYALIMMRAIVTRSHDEAIKDCAVKVVRRLMNSFDYAPFDLAAEFNKTERELFKRYPETKPLVYQSLQLLTPRTP